jgi:GR25 family glycosyltransferase involved in LPS biosynthesis
MNSISDIKHTAYINMLSRPDRKEHVEKQLNGLGIKPTRFNAISLTNGALGCSMSHLKCLETAKKNNWSHIMIVEDDILFINPELFTTQLNKFLSTHKKWDVIIIGGNNVAQYKPIDDSCVKITACQTTTGYIVNGHYLQTLIDNFRNGISNLLKFPHLHVLYAIDKYWFHLQQKDNWYLIIPLSVTQRADYSDIQKLYTNYTKAMIDLDKPQLQLQSPLQTLFPQNKSSSIINTSLKPTPKVKPMKMHV